LTPKFLQRAAERLQPGEAIEYRRRVTLGLRASLTKLVAQRGP
jgi:hypothetical protein